MEYILVRDIKEKQNLILILIYTYCRNSYQQGSELLNREFKKWKHIGCQCTWLCKSALQYE